MKRIKKAAALFSVFMIAAVTAGCGANKTAEKSSAALSAASSAQSSAATSAASSAQSSAQSSSQSAALSSAKQETSEKEKDNAMGNTMNVVINGKTYAAELDSGKAAMELKAMLPLTLSMSELNGNEKYATLPKALSQQTFSPGEIHAGDILLWGGDTLVIFYESFPTQYTYTRIGRLTEPSGIAAAVGSGSVNVSFE